MKHDFYSYSLCGLLTILLILNTACSGDKEQGGANYPSLNNLLKILEIPSHAVGPVRPSAPRSAVKEWDNYQKQCSAVHHFLQGKTADEIEEFLKSVTQIKNRSGKIVALDAIGVALRYELKNLSLPESSCQDLLTFANKGDALMDIAVAELLPNTKAWLETKLTLCVNALSSEDLEIAGDPPKPAVFLAKEVLCELPQTKEVDELLFSAVPRIEDLTFFHLVDVLRIREIGDGRWLLGFVEKMPEDSPEKAGILRQWWQATNRLRRSGGVR